MMEVSGSNRTGANAMPVCSNMAFDVSSKDMHRGAVAGEQSAEATSDRSEFGSCCAPEDLMKNACCC